MRFKNVLVLSFLFIIGGCTIIPPLRGYWWSFFAWEKARKSDWVCMRYRLAIDLFTPFTWFQSFTPSSISFVDRQSVKKIAGYPNTWLSREIDFEDGRETHSIRIYDLVENRVSGIWTRFNVGDIKNERSLSPADEIVSIKKTMESLNQSQAMIDDYWKDFDKEPEPLNVGDQYVEERNTIKWIRSGMPNNTDFCVFGENPGSVLRMELLNYLLGK